MEDRHTISEPRIMNENCGDPSWEVDILRDGVIVDSFILNKEVLPPRTNKKGKVVWKLPDNGDKLPSFGTDDRRRILEIHKERKKKRKQEKKKQTFSPSRDIWHGEECDRGHKNSSRPPEVGNAISEEEDERQSSDVISEVEKLSGKDNGKSNGNHYNQHHSVNDCARHNYNQQLEANPASLATCLCEGPSIEPQHNHQLQLSATPPPGLEMPPNISCMRLDDSQALLTFPHPLSSFERPHPFNASFIQRPSADALFITVPHNERPKSAPGQPECSLAVPAARHFISTYYSYFDGTSHGTRIVDLACYYTLEAQKSVSVGGAHSVVTGRPDIATQICNFAGTSFEVRGVVAQDTADRKGVHILVTGIARTNRSGSQGGMVASFAHSVSLVSMFSDSSDVACTALLEAFAIGYPFQIHNDALALLSGESGLASPVSSLRPTRQPPHPPGLF